MTLLTDKQEIFDTVARHLFTQGERSHYAGSCLYRSSNGLACAIGCLIPDDRYDPVMEGHGLATLIAGLTFLDKWPPSIESFTEWRNIQGFLNALQFGHDTSSHWLTTETMRKALRSIADRYGVNPSIVDTLSFEDR